MLNEDQASCEKLFVRKPSGKHRNSTLVDDNGVSEEDMVWLKAVSEVLLIIDLSPTYTVSAERGRQ